MAGPSASAAPTPLLSAPLPTTTTTAPTSHHSHSPPRHRLAEVVAAPPLPPPPPQHQVLWEGRVSLSQNAVVVVPVAAAAFGTATTLPISSDSGHHQQRQQPPSSSPFPPTTPLAPSPSSPLFDRRRMPTFVSSNNPGPGAAALIATSRPRAHSTTSNSSGAQDQATGKRSRHHRHTVLAAILGSPPSAPSYPEMPPASPKPGGKLETQLISLLRIELDRASRRAEDAEIRAAASESQRSILEEEVRSLLARIAVLEEQLLEANVKPRSFDSPPEEHADAAPDSPTATVAVPSGQSVARPTTPVLFHGTIGTSSSRKKTPSSSVCQPVAASSSKTSPVRVPSGASLLSTVTAVTGASTRHSLTQSSAHPRAPPSTAAHSASAYRPPLPASAPAAQPPIFVTFPRQPAPPATPSVIAAGLGPSAGWDAKKYAATARWAVEQSRIWGATRLRTLHRFGPAANLLDEPTLTHIASLPSLPLHAPLSPSRAFDPVPQIAETPVLSQPHPKLPRRIVSMSSLPRQRSAHPLLQTPPRSPALTRPDELTRTPSARCAPLLTPTPTPTAIPDSPSPPPTSTSASSTPARIAGLLDGLPAPPPVATFIKPPKGWQRPPTGLGLASLCSSRSSSGASIVSVRDPFER